jgi:hypothetical protein
MNSELEFIKLKVDWYKSVFPWVLAMVAGALTFANSINTKNESAHEVLILLVASIVLLLVALITMWYAALALIHRLEPPPYKTKSRFLNLLFWVPHGFKSEMAFASVANFSLGGGLAAFAAALVIHPGT